MTLQSQNLSVDGELRVRVSQDSGGATQFETRYTTPISIASNGERRVFLYVSVHDFAQEVQVELLDSSGDVVTSERANLTQILAADVLFTVVSESTTAFLDVSRVALGRGRNYQANWRLEDLPPNADALRSIDVLVFHEVDTGRLSSDHQAALAAWVASGGHLIVTGGTNWQQTTVGLLDLLPTAPSGTRNLESLADLGAFLYVSDEDLLAALEAETLITENTPHEDVSVLLEVDGTPAIVRQNLGAGVVDFLALDFDLEPLRSWQGSPRLWAELTTTASLRPSWTHGIERFELAQDAASNIEIDLPGVLRLAVFLVVYILLIGPVNYLVLYRLRRRELAWVTIPVLIGLFTVYAYVTGFSERGNAITVNQISVIQVWDDVETARADAVIGVLSPRRTTYDVLAPSDLNLRSVPNSSGVGALTQVTIRQGSDYLADDIPVDAAIMTTFATSGSFEKPAFRGSATWTLPYNSVGGRVAGEVTNPLETPLEDAVILVDDEVLVLGDLAPGETRTFELPISLDQPVRATLGSRVDAQQPVMAFTPNRCVLPNTLNIFYDNVLRDQEVNCVTDSEDDRKMLRRALMLGAISAEIDRNGGRGLGVYLVAWSEVPYLPIQMPEDAQADLGTTLFIYQLPGAIAPTNGDLISVPPGWTLWHHVESDGGIRILEVNPDLSFRLAGDQQVSVRFTPMSAVPLAQATEFDLRLNSRTVTTLRLSLFNWASGEWEEIDLQDPNQINNNQLQLTVSDRAYIGPQNSVQVRIQARDPAIPQDVTNLRVFFRGTGRSSS
ncbi:MAG: hypothetical protein HC915_08665 [Anaerolineae bacterium]|nr:hypothetical protein [Anaerolineae bacterium]